MPVVGRWLRSLLKRLYRRWQPRFLVARRMGVMLLLDQVNSVDRNLLIRGAWEPKEFQTLVALVNERAHSGQRRVFLDIGAHGALYCLVLDRHLALDRIVAFEPDPINLVQLRANLMMNHKEDRIELIEKAAARDSGRLQFHMADASNRGGSGLVERATETYGRHVEVDAVALDQIIDETGAILVGKIDVEGAELEVLSGMERLLATNDCILQIESFANARDTVESWLAARGYTRVTTIGHDHYFARALNG